MSKTSLPDGQNLAFLRGLTQPRLSRGEFMRGAAASLAAMALDGARQADAAAVTDWNAWWEAQKPTNEFIFANWPLYIDVTSDGKDHPSLDAFTKQTGISVTYDEVIQDDRKRGTSVGKS